MVRDGVCATELDVGVSHHAIGKHVHVAPVDLALWVADVGPSRNVTSRFAPIMSPPTKYQIRIAPEYVRELRARVEAVGVVAVARAAGLARKTVWRQVTGAIGTHPTPSTIEAIRRAVAKLEPAAAPPPPPLVAVRGRAHYAWLSLGDDLSPADLEREIADIAKRRGRRK